MGKLSWENDSWEFCGWEKVVAPMMYLHKKRTHLIKSRVEDDLLDGDAVHMIFDHERFVSSEVVKKDFSCRGPDPEVEAVAK